MIKFKKFQVSTCEVDYLSLFKLILVAIFRLFQLLSGEGAFTGPGFLWVTRVERLSCEGEED